MTSANTGDVRHRGLHLGGGLDVHAGTPAGGGQVDGRDERDLGPACVRLDAMA
jgi:hypothetical protein